MKTKLERIAEIAKTKKDERFTSLIHLINRDSLIECHQEIKRDKSPGVDQITWGEYDKNLVDNIDKLIGRMKANKYRPNPVLRKYIPKPGSNTKRALGIPSYEDKLVQLALSKILNAIYEQDFLDSSFGFRPKRGCHDALKALNKIIEDRNTNYIVDADIKGFFDHVDHKWLLKFLKHRISDPKVVNLITKFLKSGIMDDGYYSDSTEGTPQGGVISPILANVYLHYVLDLWFEKVVRKRCRGDAYIVRYADDFVCCFEYEQEANLFYKTLIERLKEFKLEIAEDKTNIIKFGKSASIEALKLGKQKRKHLNS